MMKRGVFWAVVSVVTAFAGIGALAQSGATGGEDSLIPTATTIRPAPAGNHELTVTDYVPGLGDVELDEQARASLKRDALFAQHLRDDSARVAVTDPWVDPQGRTIGQVVSLLFASPQDLPDDWRGFKGAGEDDEARAELDAATRRDGVPPLASFHPDQLKSVGAVMIWTLHETSEIYAISPIPAAVLPADLRAEAWALLSDTGDVE